VVPRRGEHIGLRKPSGQRLHRLGEGGADVEGERGTREIDVLGELVGQQELLGPAPDPALGAPIAQRGSDARCRDHAEWPPVVVECLSQRSQSCA